MSLWLVAQIVNSAEKPIARYLGQLGIEWYVPKQRLHVFDRRTERKRYIVRPLFPGYAFLRAWRHSLLEIPGVLGVIVDGNGEPAHNRRLDREIEALRAKHDRRGFIRIEPKSRFAPGDQVRVLTGVFREFLGRCAKVRAPGHVTVELELFGRRQPVDYTEQDLATA
jgi:transcriptional antiterminator RfaH